MNLREFSLISQKKSFRDNYNTRRLQGRPGIMGGYDTIFIKKSNIFIIHMPSVQSSFFDNIADN